VKDFSLTNTVTCTEEDLGNYKLLLTYKGQELDPEDELGPLGGIKGCIYVAATAMPGADTATLENPIAYIFASDLPTAVPEPSSLPLFGIVVLYVSGAVYRKRRGHSADDSLSGVGAANRAMASLRRPPFQNV
jgi:hypothetical protein